LRRVGDLIPDPEGLEQAAARRDDRGPSPDDRGPRRDTPPDNWGVSGFVNNPFTKLNKNDKQ